MFLRHCGWITAKSSDPWLSLCHFHWSHKSWASAVAAVEIFIVSKSKAFRLPMLIVARVFNLSFSAVAAEKVIPLPKSKAFRLPMQSSSGVQSVSTADAELSFRLPPLRLPKW